MLEIHSPQETLSIENIPLQHAEVPARNCRKQSSCEFLCPCQQSSDTEVVYLEGLELEGTSRRIGHSWQLLQQHKEKH